MPLPGLLRRTFAAAAVLLAFGIQPGCKTTMADRRMPQMVTARSTS